jgi:molybdopterin molybdotransferase
VRRQPLVAILATGDEVVPLSAQPNDAEVRNSNSYSMAAMVRRAGGRPWILPVAPDDLTKTVHLLQRALDADMILLSGGVSMGRYDFVEQALSQLGAQFLFDQVRIQPGKPLVFGLLQGKPFFGLPGNPASTMVTFELFARMALRWLAGEGAVARRLQEAILAHEFRHQPGLTRFLPARLSDDGRFVQIVPWQGSSDVPAMARANAFLVADAARDVWSEGERIRVLAK